MSKIMKATLTKTISFTDFDGNNRTIPAGQTISVVQIRSHLISSDVHGKVKAEDTSSFLGTHGNDTFDIDRDEFSIDQ